MTYYRSRSARIEESQDAGGGDFYDRVYTAERPELFFKANPHRVAGPGGTVRVRRDSQWNVPQPELALVVTRDAKIVGYTIGNDMSSRDIEGAKPLYLPQAKVYDKSCALGPRVYVSETMLPATTEIKMRITRDGKTVFRGETVLAQLKRTPESLIESLYRENSFPFGCVLLTGTGIVPPDDFTLQHGDKIGINIEPIGNNQRRRIGKLYIHNIGKELSAVRTRLSRRDFLKLTTVAAGMQLPLWRTHSAMAAQHSRTIARGPFKPTWNSLVQNYGVPEWFRDAKFGIWAHWSAQCVPEQGDWYARRMYLQGDSAYDYHVKTYGHPSKFGFMEIDNLWKAERWEPDKLMALYKRAGAKYFFALANHHDNFDAYDSKYHAWNSINVGPKKDIVGTWGKVARANGLRFGVSNHSAHSWHWFQVAYGYDAEGPNAGVRYDAAKLVKTDGKGKWWDGLDPQELYTGRNMAIPDDIASIKAMNEWHNNTDLVWNENPPPMNPAFAEKWFLRCQDLVDKYHPDVLYFDNTELPLGQVGLDIVAHYYNANLLRNKGRLEAVVNAKHMKPEHTTALVEDIERGVATGIRPHPWQTDTCIGSWHYSRAIAQQNTYKTVGQVVDMLIDIVSKNGNLMLSIPVRGDGTIDEHEVAFLEGMSAWMKGNDEGIFDSRPWKVYGEGPSTVETPETGQFGGARDVRSKPYTIQDIRFTTKGTALYAYLLAPQPLAQVVITSLATTAPHIGGRRVQDVTLVGGSKLEWSQGEQGLSVKLPENLLSLEAVALRIEGVL